jgi:PAS domain S-box-containing protein
VSVLGVGRDVPGSDWLLVVKMDEAELREESRSQVLWISAAAAFALFSTIGAGVWFAQRRALLLSLQREEVQGRQLRELQLLDAIAEGSKDLMYAKDLDGRYTFLNRAYCQLHGLASADMLGQTDEALFPPAQAERARQAERQAVAAGVESTREEVLDTPGGARVMLTTRGRCSGSTGARPGCSASPATSPPCVRIRKPCGRGRRSTAPSSTRRSMAWCCSTCRRCASPNSTMRPARAWAIPATSSPG